MNGRRTNLLLLIALATMIAMASGLASAFAAPPAPPPPLALPKQLSLAQAMQIFHDRGLDLLIAEANVASAEADVNIASAVPNPSINGGIGKTFGYDANAACGAGTPNPSSGCSSLTYTVGVNDNGALADVLFNKRGLRMDVAKKALAAAKLARIDAERVIGFQVKQAYVQVAQARASFDFAKDSAKVANDSYELNKLRYPKVIDEGVLARIETMKLEADQAVDMAGLTLRNAQISLAFLLGARTNVPDFEVDQSLMKWSGDPQPIAAANEEGMIKLALDHRPDLLAQRALKERGEAEITLGKRLRAPEFALGVQYSQTGTGQFAISPPTLLFTVTIPLPLFYTYGGEIKKGEADAAIADIEATKVQAQIVADVTSAFASVVAARKLVERMETSLLASADKAQTVTKVQFDAGAAPLMDYLDARRTFIAVQVEYLQDMTNYWTAVFQLEQAVGMELRK